MYFKTHLHSQTLTLEHFLYDLEWTLRFPTKENPNMEKALFNWPIMLQFNVKAKYRFISRKFFRHEVFSADALFKQPKATRVCIFDKPIKSFYSICCFCLVRAFISRSYKNCSIRTLRLESFENPLIESTDN